MTHLLYAPVKCELVSKGEVVVKVLVAGCTDVDDALSTRLLPNGQVEVGVHIADVSHFVLKVLCLPMMPLWLLQHVHNAGADQGFQHCLCANSRLRFYACNAYAHQTFQHCAQKQVLHVHILLVRIKCFNQCFVHVSIDSLFGCLPAGCTANLTALLCIKHASAYYTCLQQ